MPFPTRLDILPAGQRKLWPFLSPLKEMGYCLEGRRWRCAMGIDRRDRRTGAPGRKDGAMADRLHGSVDQGRNHR